MNIVDVHGEKRVPLLTLALMGGATPRLVDDGSALPDWVCAIPTWDATVLFTSQEVAEAALRFIAEARGDGVL